MKPEDHGATSTLTRKGGGKLAKNVPEDQLDM